MRIAIAVAVAVFFLVAPAGAQVVEHPPESAAHVGAGAVEPGPATVTRSAAAGESRAAAVERRLTGVERVLHAAGVEDVVESALARLFSSRHFSRSDAERMGVSVLEAVTGYLADHVRRHGSTGPAGSPAGP